MPRPADGYRNRAGEAVPGTHDPISRFMDRSALMHWAHKRGQQGLSLYDRAAIDIGSTVHGMAELDLRGRPEREIEAYAHDRLVAPDHLRKAFSAFAQFRAWRQQCQVSAIAQEVPLVSEAHQYGGTPDTIALIGGGVGLIEFKTSPKPYPDHLIAMAAHGRLWEESHPRHPLTAGYHLIILPKDGTAFQHHAYADLSTQWKLFTLYLEAYRLEKACAGAENSRQRTEDKAPAPGVTATEPQKRPQARLRGAEVAAPATQARRNGAANTERTAASPTRTSGERAARVKPETSAAYATMAELLRAYGHVKEGVPC